MHYDQFAQPALKKFINVKELLLIAIDKPDSSKELSVLQSIFRRDFYRNQLESELYLIPATFKKHISISFCDICKTFQDMDEEKRPIIKTIWTITRIALTRDAISATLKGFFFQCKGEPKLDLDQQWVEKDTTLCQF